MSKAFRSLLVVVLVATLGVLSSSLVPVMGQANKLCIVFDIGGRGDLSFNDMAALGGSQAAADFGLQLVEQQSATEADYLPNARQGPRLPDWAIVYVSTPPGPLLPGRIAAANFFGERWEWLPMQAR